MSWREAPKQLSWRRFFEITGLVGVRVEDDAVFDDTHRLILELVHAGVVDGLRIDHIDGLADPLGYLQRLRAGNRAGLLHHGRENPRQRGTASRRSGRSPVLPGYEFIASLAEVLVDDDQPLATGDSSTTRRWGYDRRSGRRNCAKPKG